MKISNYLNQKYLRNKILFYLFMIFFSTLTIGIYYNSIKDSKTIYHFGVRNSPEKDSEIFFQRASDINEDKKSINDVFKYKFGTTVNLSGSSAFYIFNDSVYEYDFNLKESTKLFEKSNFSIDDIYLHKGLIYLIGDSTLASFNLDSGEFTELSKGIVSNEISNIKNESILLEFENCKFVVEKCINQNNNISEVFDLKNNQLNKVKTEEIDKQLNNIESFFGTNKAQRQGIFKKYTKDEGNKNYNLRIFTQF